MAEPIERPFGWVTWKGSRNHKLDGGPDPNKKGNFGGSPALTAAVYATTNQ